MQHQLQHQLFTEKAGKRDSSGKSFDLCSSVYTPDPSRSISVMLQQDRMAQLSIWREKANAGIWL